MTEPDDETLKTEIDEIMKQVDVIMDKVARVIPEYSGEAEDQC
jgi:hypothetical protein